MVTIVASMAVPTQTLAASEGALLEVVQIGPLAVPTKVFSAIGLMALANGALVNMIMASRLLYGMATGDLGALADTTVLLLLAVFIVVNVSVLVLRRDEVEGDHFRVPVMVPPLGIVACLVVMSRWNARPGCEPERSSWSESSYGLSTESAPGWRTLSAE